MVPLFGKTLIFNVIVNNIRKYTLGVGDSSNSVTIVIVSVTIMTVIAKNYYRNSGHVVTGMCI